MMFGGKRVTKQTANLMQSSRGTQEREFKRFSTSAMLASRKPTQVQGILKRVEPNLNIKTKLDQMDSIKNFKILSPIVNAAGSNEEIIYSYRL